MPEISVVLDNAHGGTYIVRAEATYSVHGVPHFASGEAPGGESTTLDPIPGDAADLKLRVTFLGMLHDDKIEFAWPSPLTAYPDGRITVDLYGVWPGTTRAALRGSGGAG